MSSLAVIYQWESHDLRWLMLIQDKRNTRSLCASSGRCVSCLQLCLGVSHVRIYSWLLQQPALKYFLFCPAVDCQLSFSVRTHIAHKQQTKKIKNPKVSMPIPNMKITNNLSGSHLFASRCPQLHRALLSAGCRGRWSWSAAAWWPQTQRGLLRSPGCSPSGVWPGRGSCRKKDRARLTSQ